MYVHKPRRTVCVRTCMRDYMHVCARGKRHCTQPHAAPTAALTSGTLNSARLLPRIWHLSLLSCSVLQMFTLPNENGSSNTISISRILLALKIETVVRRYCACVHYVELTVNDHGRIENGFSP